MCPQVLAFATMPPALRWSFCRHDDGTESGVTGRLPSGDYYFFCSIEPDAGAYRALRHETDDRRELLGLYADAASARLACERDAADRRPPAA